MREWGLVKFDPSDGEYHSLKRRFFTERGARRAAVKKIKQLELEEPSEKPSIIYDLFPPQDRIFIKMPGGPVYRYRPKPMGKV